MPKYRVMMARPMTDGRHRHEVANFVSNAWKLRFTDPELKDSVDELIDCPVQRYPTDVARNCTVQAARELKVDILFQIDDDAAPPFDFFKTAFQFLTSQPEPSVIGCPYLAGDGECQVFRFLPEHGPDPQQHPWKMVRVPRPDAFVRRGVERVASIGTHCVAYHLGVFDKIKPPYYRYTYSVDHTQVVETEDCYCHRLLFEQGVPIFVDWDRWAGHWKTQCVGPLQPIPPEMIPEFWKARAKEYFLYSPEGRKELQEQVERDRETAAATTT